MAYQPGDTRHHTCATGEFMIHDLENIGGTDMVFTTVEFLDSANAPLDPPADVTAGLSSDPDHRPEADGVCNASELLRSEGGSVVPMGSTPASLGRIDDDLHLHAFTRTVPHLEAAAMVDAGRHGIAA
jgi:hypothetical protein